MGRDQKNTVDYFPHKINHGRRMFIIEERFGNNGYSTWFKLLEQLGKAEYHYIDLKDEMQEIYLASVFRISVDEMVDMFLLFSELRIIDSELFEHHSIVFSNEFNKSIKDAYARRNTKCMQKSDLCKHLKIECSDFEESEDKNPQIKQNNIKQNNIKRVVDEYTNLCIRLSKPRKLTDQRKRAINSRIKEYDLETVFLVIKKVSESDFLNGENERKWFADFDWIFKPSNFVKILEDKYKNKNNPGETFKKN